ncbi:MAG: preprotein translocase subunit SecG [Nitrospirota bacterium]
MFTFLIIIHVIVCIAVVLVVLLQQGKGADIGATFGSGGSQTVFGSRGAGNFLTKLTAAAGAIFMITSLSLAIIESHGTSSSVVKVPAGKAIPGPAAPPAMPQKGAPFVPASPATGKPASPAMPATPAFPVAPAKPSAPAKKGGN